MRFTNYCLLFAADAAASHFRIKDSRLEFRIAEKWHDGPLLPESLRARVLEQAIWRLKHMSLVPPGAPREHEASFGRVELIVGEDKPSLWFDTCFMRTARAPMLLVANEAALGIVNRPWELAFRASAEIDNLALDSAELTLSLADEALESLFGGDTRFLHVRRERARLLHARGGTESAYAELLELLAIAEQQSLVNVICNTSFDLGVIEHERGQLDSAAARLRRSLSLLSPDETSQAFAAETQLVLAQVLFERGGEERKALVLLENAAEIASKVDLAAPTRATLAAEVARRLSRGTPYR